MSWNTLASVPVKTWLEQPLHEMELFETQATMLLSGDLTCAGASVASKTLKQGSFQPRFLHKEALAIHNTPRHVRNPTFIPKRHMVYALQQNLKGRKSAGLLRNQTNHVSFPLHTFPGTRCPGPRDNLMPPLPTPSPAGKEKVCHQIHAIQ